ncbi:unnamed protein product, partial [marine sediment metagenome]
MNLDKAIRRFLSSLLDTLQSALGNPTADMGDVTQ